jgi:hypothetical protein
MLQISTGPGNLHTKGEPMTTLKKRKVPNGYLTTGQAMNLLPISRATIGRYLDSGKLEGMKNPITGMRMISKRSVVKFAKQFGLEV